MVDFYFAHYMDNASHQENNEITLKELQTNLENEKMNSLNLAVIISTAALLVSGAAFAEDTYKNNAHNQNFMSKRPYAQPLPDSAYEKSSEFEGATLIRGEVEESANTQNKSAINKNTQVQRMNQLSKRPY